MLKNCNNCCYGFYDALCQKSEGSEDCKGYSFWQPLDEYKDLIMALEQEIKRLEEFEYKYNCLI